MASPFQIASSSLSVAAAFLYSPTRRLIVLCDGSLLAATQTATGTLTLSICTNPTATTPTWSALSQTFSIASSLSIVADLYTDPAQSGGATCDVWLAYASNDGSNGANVLCAHATYTASGNSWSWDVTAATIAATNVAGQGVPSIIWAPGLNSGAGQLICAFRDGSATNNHSVQICSTSTKNGSAGWSAKAAISSVTTGNSHMICALRRHTSNLGGGGAAGTFLVYILDTGSHSDQLACRVLLDSAASAAVANWGSEATQSGTAQSGIGLCATVDPKNGQINVAWTSTAGSGFTGVNYAPVTVSGSTCTWGTHANPVTTSTIAQAGIGTDVNSRVYVFYGTGAIGSAGVVDYVYTDNSGTSWSSVQTTVAATTGDGYSHLPADYSMSAFIPWAFQRGTSSFSTQYDNTLAAGSPSTPGRPLVISHRSVQRASLW